MMRTPPSYGQMRQLVAPCVLRRMKTGRRVVADLPRLLPHSVARRGRLLELRVRSSGRGSPASLSSRSAIP